MDQELAGLQDGGVPLDPDSMVVGGMPEDAPLPSTISKQERIKQLRARGQELLGGKFLSVYQVRLTVAWGSLWRVLAGRDVWY